LILVILMLGAATLGVAERTAPRCMSGDPGIFFGSVMLIGCSP
jgi:hypothetical protein